MMFANRRDAGRRLGAALIRFRNGQAVVLALPRGGVPVAFEVAKALDAPLDVVLVRKLGAPGHAELGLGAVVDGAEPHVVLNEDIVRMVQPGTRYLEAELKRQLAEIDRRRQLYRGDQPAVAVAERTVILVDDGIATGGTVRAVLRAQKQTGPARLVLAVPVAPRDSIEHLSSEADEVIYLASPEPFYAVGAHYADFRQTTDEEVVALLNEARHFGVGEEQGREDQGCAGRIVHHHHA